MENDIDLMLEEGDFTENNYSDTIRKKMNKETDLNRETKSKLKIIEVNLDSLIDNPEQTRLSYNEDTLYDLASSIKKDGLMQPIGVKLVGDNQYQILFGHRRTRAVRLLSRKTILAIEFPAETAKKQALMSITENIQRDNMHIIDIALSIRKMLDISNFTQKEVSVYISKDVSYVNRMIKIFELPDEILNDIIANKTINDRLVLDKLRKIKDEKVCKEAYNWYKKESPSRIEFYRKVDSLLSSINNNSDPEPTAYKIERNSKNTLLEMPVLDEQQFKSLELFLKKLLSF